MCNISKVRTGKLVSFFREYLADAKCALHFTRATPGQVEVPRSRERHTTLTHTLECAPLSSLFLTHSLFASLLVVSVSGLASVLAPFENGSSALYNHSRLSAGIVYHALCNILVAVE